jgi:hypothetical protein
MRFECFGLISWGERLYSRSLLKHLVGLAKLESKSAYVGRSVIIQAQKGQLSRRTADGITLVGLERQAIHSAAGTRGCSEASYRLGSRSHFDTIDHTPLVKLCASVGLRSTHAGLIRLWLKASMPSCTKRAEAGRRRRRFCSRRFYDFGDACSAASISGAHLYRVRPSARRPVTI